MNIETIYAIIVVLIVGLIAYAYTCSDHYYKKIILKRAFENLKDKEIRTLNPEMNWEIINMNIDGYINNKKIVFNQPLYEKNDEKYKKFTDKNALAAFLNNVVVIDIDSNEPVILPGTDDKTIQSHLSTTTVSAKTPHGYHYYFYNDTGSPIPCRVGLTINNLKLPVDLLSGPKQLIFLPPTRIESECYRWINSPFEHRIEPISEHAHLLDLFIYTNEFDITPEPANACISQSIQNLLCIVWDFPIIYQFKHKCGSTPFEQLHSNQHELFYRTDSTYYLFLKHSPLKHYNAHDFVQHVTDIIHKHNINGGIVHLGCGRSYKINGDSIVQFNSCNIHDYKRHGLRSDSLRAEQTLVQTSAFTHRPISIISSDSMHETSLQNYNEDDNDDTVVNDDLFLIFMLSNETQIPCTCLVQISSSDETNEKYKKLIQYYIRNVLNATHHSSNPTQILPFFEGVPIAPN